MQPRPGAPGQDDVPPGPRRPWLLGALLLANLAAWGWAAALFHDRPALLGTALLAWVFGLRHAVDADHIAAIDNVVRKLVQDGGRPQAVGFWFSLGHSTVVVLASLALALAAATAEAGLPAIREVGSLVGTLVSGLFLLAIGAANLVTLWRLWRDLRRLRAGRAPLRGHVAAHGVLARIFAPLLGLIRRDWHMYPLGLLFGLGFDTATAVGLLGLSAGQATGGLAPWAAPAQAMVFPALFTAGMTLVDTADSVLMTGAYRWAATDPLRRLGYNLTVTALSVLVALLIGGIEVLGLVGDHLALDSPFWTAVSGLNESLGPVGFAVVGLFALCWAASALLLRRKAAAEAAGSG